MEKQRTDTKNVTNAGGKDRANIHISTEELGAGIHATGKQHSETGEIDSSTLKFVEFVDYRPKYDEQYLNGLIEKASKSWADIEDKDLWLREIRGSYDA